LRLQNFGAVAGEWFALESSRTSSRSFFLFDLVFFVAFDFRFSPFCMRRGRSSGVPSLIPVPDPERLIRIARRGDSENQTQLMADQEQHIAELQQTIATMTAQLQVLTQREVARQAADRHERDQPTTLGEYMMPTSRGPISGVVFP